MSHLVGKLLENTLGVEVMLRLFGGILALVGDIGLIACILSIRESRRQRRTPETTPRFLGWYGPDGVLSAGDARSDPVAAPPPSGDLAKHPPIWKEFVPLPFVAALAVFGMWLLLRPDHRSAEERATAEIKRLKGEVSVDVNAPGQPIVKVSFKEPYAYLLPPHRLSDSDLASLKPLLEALPQLRELDLRYADITDRGLSELQGLTQLKTLILGSQVYPLTRLNRLTRNGVNELRKALPNTEVKFDEYRYIDPEATKQLLKSRQGQ